MKTIKTYNDFMKNLNEEAEGAGYKLKLEEIAKNAMAISNLIGSNSELESWVQDKITIAHHNMDAIVGYLNQNKQDSTPKSKPLFSKES